MNQIWSICELDVIHIWAIWYPRVPPGYARVSRGTPGCSKLPRRPIGISRGYSECAPGEPGEDECTPGFPGVSPRGALEALLRYPPWYPGVKEARVS